MTQDLAFMLASAQGFLAAGFAVFIRVGAAMALVPGFGEQSVPMRVRLALAIAFTAIVAPTVPRVEVTVALMATEALVGLAFGLGLRLMVLALQTAGTIAAQSISLSQMFAGAGAEPQPVIAQLLLLAGIAAAMALGLHVRIVEALIGSYRLFPSGTVLPPGDVLEWAVGRISDAFSLAFGLAMPFVISGLIYNVAMGAINRAMPHLMVVFVGAPALTAGGMILLLAAAPLMLRVWTEALTGMLTRPF